MIEEILDLCLKEIRAKRATVADCLKQYPQYANELKPLLETALYLESTPDVKPARAFKLRTRAQLAQLSPPAPTRRSLFFLSRMTIATAAGIILAVLGLTGGLVYAASDTLPNSPLYPIKRGTEGIQILFATDPENQARVHMLFAERRLDEAKALANNPDLSSLAEQTIDEYNNQVDASLAAVLSDQTSATPLTQELVNRITRQQDGLRTLDKKISASALEKALSSSEKAKVELNALRAPQPTRAPSTSSEPTRVPGTPVPLPSTTSSPLSPLPILPTATPVLTPPLSLPTITVPVPTLAAPTIAPKPPTDIPIPKVPPIEPPPVAPPSLPTVHLP